MRTSHWSALPHGVLRHVFELQPNALDNTAASATCKAWQAALHGSEASSVTLQAVTDNEEQRWQRFLSSRSGIDSLKLVRAAPCSFSRDTNCWLIQRSDDVAQATMDSIPTACRALTLSEFCSHYLSHYVSKCPQLEQLTFECNSLQFDNTYSIQMIPHLTLLNRLTELTVRMRNDILGITFNDLIQRCPDSLQSLNLHGFGYTGAEDEQQFPVQSLHLLQHHLPALTQLHMTGSLLWIVEDITCLSKLQSLTLAKSLVYVQETLEIELLTALTFLDLSDSLIDGTGVGTLGTFTAWPSLRVLKIKGCSLFRSQTSMDFAMVQEAHVSSSLFYARVDVRTLQLHASLHQSIGSMPIWCLGCQSCIVSVKLSLSQDSPQAALEELCMLPKLCHLDLYVADPQLNHLPQQAFKPVLPLQLTSLHVRGLACTNLDLHHLTCLISLNLSNIDTAGGLGYIAFPAGLQALTFVGSSLFGQAVRHNLLDLAGLVEVTLQPHFQSGNKLIGNFVESWHPTLPRLPACVTHLTVHESIFGGLPCSHTWDWTALAYCLRLQHLTFSNKQFLERSRKLQMIMRTLPCLLVVDYDFAQDVVGQKATLVRTRLPQFDANPV